MLWRRESLEPLGPAIVWQCRRTADTAAELERSHGTEISERTGLRCDAYFSGPTLAWLLDHLSESLPDIRAQAERGEVVGGTVDSWLLARLTDGRVHSTDRSNASRTMLWNLAEGRWDKQLCEWQSVPSAVLAEVRPSADEYGLTDSRWFGRELPILAVAGDQQAALYGHGIDRPGTAKCTYGTGAFVLTHAGPTMRSLPERELLQTATVDGGVALEGGVFTAGSVVQWLRDELKLAPSATEISELAASVASSDGVTLVPALAGLGAPHWSPSTRGALLGLTRGTSSAQIARAALEAVAFRVREIVEAMERAGAVVSELRVDGGMSASEPLLQIQANALQRPVVRPSQLETTALGAARLAMDTLGWASTEAIDRSGEHVVHPNGDLEREFERWSAARSLVQAW